MRVVSHLEWHCKGFEGRRETAQHLVDLLWVAEYSNRITEAVCDRDEIDPAFIRAIGAAVL